MKGVTVEGNGEHGFFAYDGAVVQLEGCSVGVTGNTKGDYGEDGGRIER